MEAQTTEAPQTCTKCVRCGRVLRAPKSVGRALGPTCARKVKAAAAAPEAQPATVPAVASNVIPFVAPKIRRSAQIPGLTYEIASRNGVVYVEFRQGCAFEVVALAEGKVQPIDCSDRHGFTRPVLDHCRAVAQQLAARLVAQ